MSSQPRPDFGPGGLPPLPTVNSSEIETRVFTHRSFAARPTHVFEDTPEDPSPDNEQFSLFPRRPHLSLAIDDLLPPHPARMNKLKARACGRSSARLDCDRSPAERVPSLASRAINGTYLSQYPIRVPPRPPPLFLIPDQNTRWVPQKMRALVVGNNTLATMYAPRTENRTSIVLRFTVGSADTPYLAIRQLCAI
jgi:hypothetical protein